MKSKFSTVKLKAQIAMAAFVVVAIAAIMLTSAGIVEYTMLNVGAPTDTIQVSTQPATLSITSAWSGLVRFLGN